MRRLSSHRPITGLRETRHVDYTLFRCRYSRLPSVSDIHVVQGSVATHLGCGGIFKYDCVAKI